MLNKISFLYSPKKYLLIIILACISISCKNNNSICVSKGLKKLTDKELIIRAKNRTLFDMQNTIFKNELCEIINKDSLEKIPNVKKFIGERYVDENGVIKEIIIKKGTEKEVAFKSKLIDLYKKNYTSPTNCSQTKIVDKKNIVDSIDCKKLKTILNQIYKKDQNHRIEENPNQNIDDENLEMVINIINKCGMPIRKDVGLKGMSTIWLVLQHSDNVHRKKYFPYLEKASRIGDIKKSQLAMMQDRILMMEGKPQIYGTQVIKKPNSKNWILYSLDNPNIVNKKRDSVGLEPIEDYLKNFGINKITETGEFEKPLSE